MNKKLQEIINRPDTWIAKEHPNNLSISRNEFLQGKSLSTGFTSIDDVLHLNGWPLGASIEIFEPIHTNGSMNLLLPAMKHLNRQNRWQVFIAPPYIPYAPMLLSKGIDIKKILLIHPKNKEELLWTTEQTLRSTTCSTVFSWFDSKQYRYSELKRLQLAAAEGDMLSILFRDDKAKNTQAPSILRLLINNHRRVTVLKQRGGKQDITIQLTDEENSSTQLKISKREKDRSKLSLIENHYIVENSKI